MKINRDICYLYLVRRGIRRGWVTAIEIAADYGGFPLIGKIQALMDRGQMNHIKVLQTGYDRAGRRVFFVEVI